jgi:hypothetical protein
VREEPFFVEEFAESERDAFAIGLNS